VWDYVLVYNVSVLMILLVMWLVDDEWNDCDVVVMVLMLCGMRWNGNKQHHFVL